MSLHIFGFDVFFVDWNMLLCNFQREQKWERWLSTIRNGMRMHKTIVLVFLHRIAASQTEINFENNIKDFMESEIWQHKHSKKIRNRFFKSWLPCNNILLISVFILILILSSDESALLQFTDLQEFCKNLCTFIFVGLSHCQHFYVDKGKELEMLECTWI